MAHFIQIEQDMAQLRACGRGVPARGRSGKAAAATGGTLSKSERLKGSDPDARGPYTPMARTRRSPKKLRLAKSPRTARAAPRTPTRKVAAREGKTARPALRTYDATTARQLGAARKAWEQGEVAKSLARAPERRTEFTTDSGIPLPVRARRRRTGRGKTRETSGSPASSRTPAACSRRCTGGGCGRCGSSPGSAARPTPTSASSTSWRTARPGCPPPSTCPRSWATTPTTR